MLVLEGIAMECERSIHDLIESGSIAELGDMLHRQPRSIEEKDDLDNYPIHTACWEKQTQALGLLIESGADVNARGGRGDTPLHLAVTEGNAISLPLVSELIANGANPLIRNDIGHTAIDWAKIQMDDCLAEVLNLMKNSE
ncbi:MAG: ankyrin repeat domain-containing protein [Planctomycetota bacterium]